MRGFTDLLIPFHVLKGICGRGPALFGCLFVFAIPFVLLAVLIDQLYPRGFGTFAWKALATVLRSFH